MAETAQLAGIGKIIVNDKEIPGVRYKIPKAAEPLRSEALLEDLYGQLVIEGEAGFLWDLLSDMTGGHCILYLEDGRYIDFIPDPNTDIAPEDSRVYLNVRLNGPLSG